MSAASTDELWAQLSLYGDAYTCYSSAIATWVAYESPGWAATVDPGLWLMVSPRPGGLFAFAHFPPQLRPRLGLLRTGAAELSQALDGVLEELGRRGRVIVAGDGLRLPWHVAFSRRHVPHWFVLVRSDSGPAVIDPFSCRNELGIQQAHRAVVEEARLGPLLEGLPGGDPVLALRESLALGDEVPLPGGCRYQWLVAGAVDGVRPASGVSGADAASMLATHFRDRGQDPLAYRQADDIWSIARHRAFHCRRASLLAEETGDEVLRGWVSEHGTPLTRRWSHMAPLMMQATLALGAGREASDSVPAMLEQLAELERAAAAADPTARAAAEAGVAWEAAALPSPPDRRHDERLGGGA